MKYASRIIFVILIVLPILPGNIVSAQEPDDLAPIQAHSLSWLEAAQTGTGSWGDTVPIRDTTVVIKTLTTMQPGSPTLPPAYAWLLNQPARSNDDLARLTTALAKAGFDVSPLAAELLARQNAPEPEPEPIPYEDDFGDPASGWPQSDNETATKEYVGGEYRILVKQENKFVSSSAGPSFTDFDAQVQARYQGSAENKAYSLLFHFQDGDNFYDFDVSPISRTYALFKQVNDVWHTIVSPTGSEIINGGEATNLLRVVCQGPEIRLYANDQLLTAATDDTFSEGQLGLAVTNYSDPAGADGYFDNLTASGVYDIVRPNYPEGGWGIAPGYATDSLRTALALEALKAASVESSSLSAPIAYLLAAQNGDGGWGISKGAASNLSITAQVLLTLQAYVTDFDLEAAIGNGAQYLVAQQNPDGGWGGEGSNAHESALVYHVLDALGVSPTNPDAARFYILAYNRSSNGSWNNQPYDTALSLLALGEQEPPFHPVYIPIILKSSTMP